ncbi:MAG: 3-methyl-2-oxobutanoate hydroxymethyltransferase [Candidatus Kapaibacteriota bacterium]|jgi:3-methyl-2-oxobutanoate hydroxymethyltransferase
MSVHQNIDSKKITTKIIQEMKDKNIKISCLTSYDYLTTRIVDKSGIDIILVGDSLGNVFQGHETTLTVTVEEIIYHSKAVVKGAKRALVVADMPFMSYQITPDEALRNAGKIMKETGCSAVKLEGGKSVSKAIKKITKSGIPVMGHLGLTPQSINRFGGYQARGTTPDEAEQIIEDSLLLQEAGAFAVVLEKIPAQLAKNITEKLTIPTIGIGAGKYCDGQILVNSDMLGLSNDFNPRFVRRYANLEETIGNAITNYINDVKSNFFPNEDESY